MDVDLKTGGFKGLGEYMNIVRKVCVEGHKDRRLDEIQELWLKKRREKTAGHMEESIDSQGGHLVPEQWAAGIYHAALEKSIVRSRATIFPTVSDSLKVRKLTETDRSSNIFGGITFQWVEERGDKVAAQSKPEVGTCELNPHKLVGGCFVSNELESDSDQLGKFVEVAFGQAIRFIEDDYFLWGTGAGVPLGAIHANNGSLITVTRNAIGAINWTDIAHMIERLLPASWETAVWLINPGALDELFELTAPAANQATFLPLHTRQIAGMPFIPTEKCQAMGTQGDIALCDFKNGHYLIADREMRIAASRHVDYGGGHYGWLTDETYWKIVLRVDGQPLMTDDITPYRGAATISPFIVLTTTS